MQDHPIRSVADQQDADDFNVLALLLDSDAQRPWSLDEIAQAIGDPIATADSLARLHGAGLVHRLHQFVFAARPAVRFDEIAQ